MKRISIVALSLALLMLCGARADNGQAQGNPTPQPTTPSGAVSRSEGEADPVMQIDGRTVQVAWEDNESVDALRQRVASKPLSIAMSMYGGFEQVGPLGFDLPRSDAQTTTQPGDIVLYAGSNLVVFYGSNSWAYTRLGRIAGLTEAEIAALLANGDVTITLTP